MTWAPGNSASPAELLIAVFAIGLLGSGQPGMAQTRVPIDVESLEQNEQDDGRVVIDILAPPKGREPLNDAEKRQCERESEAAIISGEIIVCAQLGEDSSHYYSGDRDAARKRYAEETAFAGDIRAPDVAGGGIFRGPATVSGQCFIPPCPKPPALIIDVEALPEAPPGSDADRIARGLEPLGDNDGTSEAARDARNKALGLPETPEAETRPPTPE